MKNLGGMKRWYFVSCEQGLLCYYANVEDRDANNAKGRLDLKGGRHEVEIAKQSDGKLMLKVTDQEFVSHGAIGGGEWRTTLEYHLEAETQDEVELWHSTLSKAISYWRKYTTEAATKEAATKEGEGSEGGSQ
jgi:hypothetical protein